MIIVTGAYGFIGSMLVRFLNQKGYDNLVLVDDFSIKKKADNLLNTNYLQLIERDQLFSFLKENTDGVKYIFHLGARTDTTETDRDLLDRLNLNYTQYLWNWCSENNVPLLYASSAATYGLGEHGFVDSHEIVDQLQPLNAYGDSKNDFDKWALAQAKQPPSWIGLKFFNVYGEQEYHKGRMASVVFHTFRQIQQTGGMKLFRSHRADVADGQQSRDFIYVEDVLKICYYFFENQQVADGLYNVGTGQARPFWDLATATFKALNLAPNISFIDTPADIREKYQYFTEADLTKLRAAGYTEDFYSLEAGVTRYVKSLRKLHS
ncbi:MAG: ADP-glyceromanno-heptose 6-epimerase [Saprospiraceae bacterium]